MTDTAEPEAEAGELKSDVKDGKPSLMTKLTNSITSITNNKDGRFQMSESNWSLLKCTLVFLFGVVLTKKMQKVVNEIM